MNALLVAIDAKFTQTNLAVRSLRQYATLHSTSSFSLELAEFTINQPIFSIVTQLYHTPADVYLFSSYIWNIEEIKAVILDLHQIKPAAKFFLGGPEATYHTESLLKELPMLDGIMVGEGEASLLELLTALCEGTALTQCRGLALPSGYTTHQLPLAMDDLPFPYTDFPALKNRTLYYESMRGCPFACSYCLSSVEQGVRFRSLPLVFADLQRFLDANVRQVKFVDRTFNCKKSHAMGIWQFLKEQDNGYTNFHFEIAGELLTDDMLEFLSTLRPGQVQFEIGVQSTHTPTLEEIDRHFSFSQLTKNVKTLQKYNNIHLHLDLIAGLPYESYQRFQTSFNQVYDLRPHQLQLGFLKVLGGSKMEVKAPEYGLLYQATAPYEVLQTRWISFEELSLLHGVDDMVDHYYNSGRYQHILEEMIHRHYCGDPFHFYLELSQHFILKSAGRPVSKTGYQEILGSFWKAKGYPISSRMQWLMKYDLLLHENLRSVPSWVTVSLEEDYREYIRDFYSTPEHLATFLPVYTKKYPRQAARGDSKHASRLTHMEVFPFHPDTGVPQATAVLFDYFQRDIQGNVVVSFHTVP